MSDQIKITMPEVAASCGQIRTFNSELDEVLASITNTMNSLSASWDSSGAETIVARFKKFSARFTQESDTIEQYCKFLDYTVSSYENLESTITANANNFE